MASSLHQISTTQDSLKFDRVAFVDVSKYFGRRRALAHVSLECGTGEILGFLGGNGAGKSTLLALAGTILDPSSGEIRYGGGLARELGPALRGNIGLLSHDFQLYPELTARENLEFFAALYGLDQIGDRSHEALRSAELLSRGDDFVGGFSRGMRQRVALERTLLHEPQLVLLDEPFSGLDLRLRKSLRSQTLGLLRELGTTTLMVTHDPEEALLMADHIAVMRNGRILQEGTGSELYAKPANAFCAAFLGETLEHKVYVSSPVVDTPFGAVEVDAGLIGSEVCILVRPEGIIFDTNRDPIEVKSRFVSGRLTDLRAIGAYRQVSLKLHNSGLEVRFLSSRAVFPEVGSDVGIGVDPSMVFVFPVGAGEELL